MNSMNYLKLMIPALAFACMVESGYSQNSISFSAAAPTEQTLPSLPAAKATPAQKSVQKAASPAQSSDPDITATPVGRVVWVKGGSFMAITGIKQRNLAKASIIYLNDQLITGDNTSAEIVFTDNTLITFNPGTTFNVDNYSYTPGKAKGSVGKSVMSIIQGGFRTITGLIAKSNPTDYSMNTPVATIGVRGTDYRVQLTPDGQLYIGFNEGRPCVKSKSGSSELCLDNTVPYAKVANANSNPQGMSQKPDVFQQQQQQEITPAKIAGFGSIGQGGSGGGGGTSSFCISQ